MTIIRFGILSAALVSFASFGVLGDEPDAALESRFHKIYIDFNSKSMNQGEWQGVVGPRQSETYVVQPGDTLWDLSTTFFGNGFFWPKLWQVNNEITNPHDISPGQKLKFISGTTEDAPEVKIVEAEAGQESLAKLEQPPAPEVQEGVTEEYPTIPEIPHRANPVLRQIPPSLPPLAGTTTDGSYDPNGFSLEKEVDVTARVSSVTSIYLAEEEPQSVGEVVEFESGTEFGSINDKIKIRGTGLSVGNTVTLWHSSNSVKDGFDGGTAGEQINVGGEAKILGFNSENSLFDAKIIKHYSLIPLGSKISKGGAAKHAIGGPTRINKMEGRVIGAADEKDRELAGPWTTVFINLGAANGVKANDVFRIYKDSSSRNTIGAFEVGRLRVNKVGQRYSTAVIVYSNDHVHVGDRIGGTDSDKAKNSAANEQSVGDSDNKESDSESDSELE